VITFTPFLVLIIATGIMKHGFIILKNDKYMAISKYLDRLIRIDALIQCENTGNTYEFAEKLGLSRRQLLDELKEIREFGIHIEFNFYKNTYAYKGEVFIPNLFRSNLN